jgi:monoamine oxidase
MFLSSAIMKYDVIIVGAGASGLQAALSLLSRNIKVLVLEARNRAGGRIHTIKNGFTCNTEAGAEFVHGNLPKTMELLEQYEIKYHKVKGTMFRVEKGHFQKDDSLIEHYREMENCLQEIRSDISVEEFLRKYFSDHKYESLRSSMRRFVEGYDAADIKSASTLSFRKEWMNEDDNQFRIENGYSVLVNAMTAECINKGCTIIYNEAVKEINFENDICITTKNSTVYQSQKVILTVPLGILQLENDDENAIQFKPPISEYISCAAKIGYGNVIKFLLEFKTPFWASEETKKKTGTNLSNLGWIFSDEKVPTWWTQAPRETLLTGWLAGPQTVHYANFSKEDLLKTGINSLSSIFHSTTDELMDQLNCFEIYNWQQDSFANGAYCFETVDSNMYRNKLNEGIKDKIFFAGEAMSYENTGTVEAAFASGFQAAGKIIRLLT